MKQALLLLHFAYPSASRAFFILLLVTLSLSKGHSQNIGIGTTSPQAKLHIKGNADTSQLIIDANTTQSNTNPLIRFRNASGNDILHLNSDNRFNVFLGLNAGKMNLGGAGGVDNTFIGYFSGAANAGGKFNVAVGSSSFRLNTYGDRNTAVGVSSLYSNTSGNENTAVGQLSLIENTTGYSNTAVGSTALNSNTTGYYNSAQGASSMLYNTTGNVNTAVGYNALLYNATGSYNTAVGAGAGPASGSSGLNNIVCLGNIATATASDQIVLGNSSNNQLYCYAAYAATTAFGSNLAVLSTGQIVRIVSSRRYKKDITDMEINSSDIYKLRPVSYTSINDNSRHFGLVAEEVAEVIPQLAEYAPEKNVVKGSTSDKLIPDAVQYPMLSVLLLKEVQKHEQIVAELQAMIKGQQKQIEELKKLINELLYARK